MSGHENIIEKTHYKHITDGLVFPEDLGDILDMEGVDASVTLENREVITKNIKIIREALEDEFTVYDMTDEEMIEEIDKLRLDVQEDQEGQEE